MSEKHKPVPVAWARMKGGKIISVFHDKKVAEFLSGFAASELVPLYMHAEQPAAKAQMEAAGWQFYQDGKWWNGDDRIKDHKKNTLAAGFRVRDVYAYPQSATEAGDHRKFTFWAVYDATSAQKYIKMDADTGCLAIFDIEGRAAGFASDYPGAAYGELVLYSCPQPAPDVAKLVEALQPLLQDCLDFALDVPECGCEHSMACSSCERHKEAQRLAERLVEVMQ